MPAARWQAGRLADEVAVLGMRGLPREDYFRELTARIHRAIDCDATCWHTLDPDTRLITSDMSEELVSSGVYTAETAPLAGAGVIASEYLVDDLNTFASLAQKRVPVGTLHRAARGKPERSARYNTVLEPSGIPFELRAAFVTRGRAWGAVHIARREGGDFSDAEIATMARIAGAVAAGIRTSLRVDAARRADTGAPGLVVLGPHNEVEVITEPARALMDELRSSALRGSSDAPPSSVIAVAGAARSVGATDAVSIPGGGGWITMHASLPEGRADGRVAIVLERARGRESATLQLETYGVTPREREVATLLAQGCTNAEIATALVLSPYTVEDHIKSLFEKVRVGSRREFVARIFLQDYLPAVAEDAPLTAGGKFASA